tara:strand:+ start:264 stop:611 length:348 start_codon:yes stop_codon:yes gene_type:complete
MIKKTKKYIIPGTVLLTASYLSVIFTAGGILGYWLTNIFCKRYVHTGKVKTLEFGLGDWKVHLHHWITGGLAILLIYFMGFMYTVPIFFIGAITGLIFHDLHTDDYWHKVVYKEE